MSRKETIQKDIARLEHMLESVDKIKSVYGMERNILRGSIIDNIKLLELKLEELN